MKTWDATPERERAIRSIAMLALQTSQHTTRLACDPHDIEHARSALEKAKQLVFELEDLLGLLQPEPLTQADLTLEGFTPNELATWGVTK